MLAKTLQCDSLSRILGAFIEVTAVDIAVANLKSTMLLRYTRNSCHAKAMATVNRHELTSSDVGDTCGGSSLIPPPGMMASRP